MYFKKKKNLLSTKGIYSLKGERVIEIPFPRILIYMYIYINTRGSLEHLRSVKLRVEERGRGGNAISLQTDGFIKFGSKNEVSGVQKGGDS